MEIGILSWFFTCIHIICGGLGLFLTAGELIQIIGQERRNWNVTVSAEHSNAHPVCRN